ncbi:hypothetical protein BDF14DRAFT_1717230, partial [Spinellus fusiger]
YIQHLKELVSKVHHLMSHTFSFLKYIFIHKLEDDPRFLLEDFINGTIFKGIFLSLLTNYKLGKEKATEKERVYKELVLRYREHYFQYCSYNPIDMNYAHQEE